MRHPSARRLAPHAGTAATGHGRGRRAFTIIEVTITLLCLAIAAAIVMPTVTDNGPDQLRGAAQMFVADLAYAQAQSLSHGDDPRMLVIEPSRAAYSIAPKSRPNQPIANPVGGAKYVTKFGQGRAAALGKVRVGPVGFNGDDQLAFGGLGQLDQTMPATITLTAGPRSVVITIDPITGEASVGPIL